MHQGDMKLVSRPGRGRASLPALGIVLAAHGGLLFALTLPKAEPVPPPIERPILISLVMPEPAAAPVPPQPEPAKPKAVTPKPVLPKPVVRKPKPVPIPEPVQRPPEPQLVAQAAPEPAAEAAPAADPSPPPQTSQEPVEPAPPEPSQDRVEAVEPPRFNADYLDNPKPAYPSLSRRMGEQGRVLLRVLVDTAGRPARVVLHQSSSYPRLDETALSSVRQWKFQPARQAGHPVEAWVVVPIQFSLRG